MDNEKIGQLLIRKGFITQQQLAIALEEQKHRNIGARICNILIEMGFVDADICYAALAEKLGFKSINVFIR